jgi:lycopene cyclase domain-containing protein
VTFAYLGALIVSLAGMALLDRAFTLFFWKSPVRAALVLVVGVTFFACWDLLGIGWGIFRRGETDFMSGIVLAPEFPLEELFFLTFLCYLTVILVFGIEKIVARRAGTSGRRGGAS